MYNSQDNIQCGVKLLKEREQGRLCLRPLSGSTQFSVSLASFLPLCPVVTCVNHVQPSLRSRPLWFGATQLNTLYDVLFFFFFMYFLYCIEKIYNTWVIQNEMVFNTHIQLFQMCAYIFLWSVLEEGISTLFRKRSLTLPDSASYSSCRSFNLSYEQSGINNNNCKG